MQPRSRAYQGVTSKLTAHEQQNTVGNQFTPYGRQNDGGDADIGGRPRGLSFKDRQRQKKEKADEKSKAAQVAAKPVESLADRRNKRKNLIDQDNMNQVSNDLDKLKQNAENYWDEDKKEAGIGNALEDISEEDAAEDQ